MSHRQRSSRAWSYQRYTVEVILEPSARALVSAARLGFGERVLDLACGTGVISRLAATDVGTAGGVTAVDIDPDSLAVARAIAQEGARIDWRLGDVAALAFPYGTFDAALCSQGLQFFPDRVQALREASRVLRPQGRLAACVWRSREHNPYYQALKEALDRHLDPRTAARMDAPFALGNPAELRRSFLAARLDCEIEARSMALRMPPLDEFIPGHMSGMSIAEELGSLNSAAVRDVIQRVKFALRRYEDEQGLRVPFEIYVVLARRRVR